MTHRGNTQPKTSVQSRAGHGTLLHTHSTHRRLLPLHALPHAQVTLRQVVATGPRAGAHGERRVRRHASLLPRVREGT